MCFDILLYDNYDLGALYGNGVISESAVKIDGYSILLMLHIFIILLKLGVIALGVMLIVSRSSATEGELLLSEYVSLRILIVGT